MKSEASVLIILMTAILIVLEAALSLLVPLIAKVYSAIKRQVVRWYLYNPTLDSYYSSLKQTI